MPLSETTLNALIAAGGVVAGAVVTAVASRFTAQSKIAEVQTVYQQKLRDSYLENARKYTNNLYVPLTIHVASLEREYRAFQAAKARSPETTPADFVGACRRYLNAIDELSENGANAFLTTELETALTQLTSFIAESIDASKSVRSVVVEVETRWPFPRWSPHYTSKTTWRWARFLKFSMSAGGVRVRYSNELMAAPLPSDEFAKAFAEQSASVRLMLKEVTLGSQKMP